MPTNEATATETYDLTIDEMDGHMTYTASNGTRVVILACEDDYFSVAKYLPGEEESEWESLASDIDEALEMAEYAIDWIESHK